MSNFVDKKFLTNYGKDCKILFKSEVIKIKQKQITIQEWLPIDKIYNDGFVKLKNNKLIKILKINPINYNLKSDLEKKSILNSYKIFLKTCNFNIQILIQSNKEDLTHHIKNIKNNISKKENKYLEKIADNYINYIQQINLTRKSSSKDFYIILSGTINKKMDIIESEEIVKNDLKDKYFKVKECLARSGNLVSELSTSQEVEKLFFSLLNTRKNLNNKLIKIN